jgi:hypothetical protein
MDALVDSSDKNNYSSDNRQQCCTLAVAVAAERVQCSAKHECALDYCVTAVTAVCVNDSGQWRSFG